MTNWNISCREKDNLQHPNSEQSGEDTEPNPGRTKAFSDLHQETAKTEALFQSSKQGDRWHKQSILWAVLTGGDARWEVEELLEELPEPELG